LFFRFPGYPFIQMIRIKFLLVRSDFFKQVRRTLRDDR
jgi:hypothetical protein